MNWYKQLSINQKIFIKENCKKITGLSFSDLGFLFSYKERIDIIYNKLILEGIIKPCIL
jgi:hypothetical protein